jgi:3-oxoadipate enol-lactonase
MEGVVEPTVTRWFTPATVTANPPSLDRVRDMLRSTNPVGHEGCCEALKRLAFGPGLNKITVPTLIIGGDEDKGAPPAVLAEAAAAIPDCRHVVIEKAGHIANIENPAAVNAAILAFMDELTVAA